MTVKITAGSLTRGPTNGLDAIEAQLIDNPAGKHVVIGIVDTAKVTTDTLTGEVTPTMRFVGIEAFPAAHPDGEEVRRLWRRQAERRQGKDTGQLPLDLELALDEITISTDGDTT